MTVPATFAQTLQDEWLTLLSIPVTAAFIGWVTKLLAIEMMFRPLRFVGIGPIGWQGMVPRRTAKSASLAADMIVGELLDPRELIDQLDPDELVAQLEGPLLAITNELAREIAARYHPALWDETPEPARRLILARVRSRAPEVVGNLLAEVRRDIDDVFDLRYMMISNLARNKDLMIRFVRETIGPEIQFMVRMGIVFGFAVGAVQAIIWALTHNHLVLPLFGGAVGLFSDYIALQMILEPPVRTRYLGLFSWHGMFFRRREEFSRAYARFGAHDLVSPRVIIDSVMQGPLADRLFALTGREVQRALDSEAGIARPLVQVAIGTEQYRAIKHTAIERARERIDQFTAPLETYAEETIQIEQRIGENLMRLEAEKYAGIIRPLFKDDEWVVVAVGGLLGFLVGEIQVTLITHL